MGWAVPGMLRPSFGIRTSDHVERLHEVDPGERQVVGRGTGFGNPEGFGQNWARVRSPGPVSLVFSCAPVAQLDRAFASGAKGRWFESTRAYQLIHHQSFTDP
jgi:hypothetical protein